MKTTSRILSFVLLLSAVACARDRIIPDRELAMIFHDAFLANAYVQQKSVDLDSLNIYEPIFAKYGYTTEDVQYTIGNFSKRKSARLSDVVEEAIARLEIEGRHYDKEVSILDTVDRVAQRTFTRTVLADSLIRVKSLRDTSKLSFVMDVLPGEYRVSLDYMVDSLDKNKLTLRSILWLECTDSTRTSYTTNVLRRDNEEHILRTFRTDSSHRRLHMHLLTFGKEKPQRPSVTVRNLKVDYIPPADRAVDSLYAKQLDIRIFADEFFETLASREPQDSIPQTLE